MSSPSPTLLPVPDYQSPQSRFSIARWLELVGPLLALLAIFLLFYAMIGPTFASFFNIHAIFRQSTITCMAALGTTFIIIAGGIDLSIGSSVALSAMLIATLLNYTHHYVDPDTGNIYHSFIANGPAGALADGHPIAAAIAERIVSVSYTTPYPVAWPLLCATCGILIGLACGLFNGLLITQLRLAPFIVTLAAMMIFRGHTEGISVVGVNAEENWLLKLLYPPDLPQWVAHSAAKPLLQWLFLAPGIWIMLACAIVMAILLKYFRFGRYTIAIGSNEQTARLCGIPVNRTKILIYLLGGLFCGIAGVMQYSRQRQGSPAAAVGLELDVIAGCVIGGASLNGGKGSIFGTLIGALIMTVIGSGCSQVPVPVWVRGWVGGNGHGLPTHSREIVTGYIIIIAVALDNLRQRRSRT